MDSVGVDSVDTGSVGGFSGYRFGGYSGGMQFSHRVDHSTPNAIALKRAESTDAGWELTDLTDTNPTRHGLFDPAILDVLGCHVPRASRYDPHPRGPWSARAALAERYGGDPEDYWLVSSTSEAYGWAFTLLGDPGDAVAIPSPGYPLIEPLARYHDLSVLGYRSFYVHPSGWELDRDHLAKTLADKRIRAVVAVNPNNPTGAYAEDAIAAMAAERGLPLIADEVFFPFRLDGGAGEGLTPIGGPRSGTESFTAGAEPVRLSGNHSCLTFGLDGLSKLLAAPQLKLGWIRLSGPPSQMEEAARALDQIADTYLPVNSVVASALPDLLNLADSSIARVTARLRTNLAAAHELFPDLRIRTVYGGWMMLLDVPPVMDADTMCISLMERAGLYVHPGYFYDLPDSTLAISLLPDPSVFRESCQRLAAALTVFTDEETLTGEQLAMINRRAAEMEANPSIGMSESELMEGLRAKWA